MRFKHLPWAVLFVLISSSAPTQQPPAGSATSGTVVELTPGASNPTGTSWVPLKLTSAPGVKVGRLDLIITFPKALLAFLNLETSGLTDGIEAQVTTDVRDNPQDASQRQLLLKISTLDGKTTRIPFPDGKLVYLVFQVAEQAKPMTTIALGTAGQAVTVDDPPKPIQPFAVRASPLEVTLEPLTSCFFYMH